MTGKIAGSTLFQALLADAGVTTLFDNPGTTELPIKHALTEQQEVAYVIGLQESVVVAMADGYARASGRLAACNVHIAPGLANAMGALYTAFVSGSPVLVTSGQQEQGHGLMEPLLYAPLVPIATPVVKWAVNVTRIDDLPRIMHRALKVALTEPTGPVFISLPGDILNSEAAINLSSITSVDTGNRPSVAPIEQPCKRLLNAETPVIVAGHEVVASNAFAEVADFASILGAPVYQQMVNTGSHFPSEHPAHMGSLYRDQSYVREIRGKHDLLICIGSDVLRMSVHSDVDQLPETTSVVQIGLRDWELGKNYTADIAIRADVKHTLLDLNSALAGKRGGFGYAC